MKKLAFLAVVVFSTLNSVSIFAQTTIYSESFEGAVNSGYTSSGVFSDGTSDYFDLIGNGADPTGHTTFTGIDGTQYWGGEDTDDAGNPNGTGVGVGYSDVTISGINISGYTSINIIGAFASNGSTNFDGNDHILVYANVDGGGEVLIGAFENTTGASNAIFSQDTDLDGNGDGTALTTTLTDYTFALGSTGNSLDIRIEVYMQYGSTDVGFDNIRVQGTSSCTAPTVQATSFGSSSIGTTTATVSWTRGNGNNVLVVAQAGSAASAPSSGTTYTANAAYGSGDPIGSGFVVYNGTGTSVNLTGLTAGTTYHFAIFEYATTGTCYLTPGLTGNLTTILDTDGEFSSASGSVAETAGTYNLPLTINNYSTTATTTVTIELTSGDPGLTDDFAAVGNTINVVVPANTGSYNYSLDINDNGTCGSNGDLGFAITSVTGGQGTPSVGTQSTYTLTVTDDEGISGAFETLSFEGADNFTYTGGGATSTTANKFNGTTSYELTGSQQLETENVDISSYTNVTLQVAFASSGPDSGEDLFLDISYDNGATWTGTGSVKLVDGWSNANIDINTTNASNPTTVGSNPWTVSIPGTETQIKVRLRAVALDAGEYYYVDDIILSGDYCPCTPTHSITSFAPTSGPEMTEITVTGTGFTTSTTADFGGIAANVTYVSSTTLIVEVPTGANDGPFTLTEGSCPLDASSSFTLINTSGTCGGALFSDIIISEVYDNATGSLGYIEIFNGTGATVDLTTYSIDRYGTIGGATPTHTYTFPASGTGSSIAHNQVLYGRVSTDANIATPDFDFGGTTAGFNDDDRLELMNGGSIVDDFHDGTVSAVGYVYQRSTGITGPNTTWTAAEWTTVAAGTTSDLGTYSVSFNTPPTVTDEPDDTHACSILKGITATAGSGGGALTYQWLYNDGTSAGWSNVTAGAFPLATVSGETSANLSITGTPTDIATYDGYQFYCLVTEGGTCNTASDAAQFRARTGADPEMTTVMINSCDASCGSEGYNEFFALETGDAAIDVTTASNLNISYGTSYPANTSYADGFTADPTLTATFNTANGCSLFNDAVTTGTIPANSTILIMSENVCATAYDFTSLCGSGPIYLLYSTDLSWGSTGNFSNGTATTRYFSVEFTDVNGLVTNTEYEYEPNSLSGADGDYADFEYCSAPASNYGNDACRVIALPVEILFFDAYKKEDVVELIWETGSEINNDKFVVMRSTNGGESYQPIGEVKGQGNSTVLNHYSFTDLNPQTGENYYKLYQYDLDGAYAQTDVQLVNFNDGYVFEGYSNGVEVVLEYDGILPNSTVEIYTIEGKLIDSFTLEEKEGLRQVVLPTQSYYLIRLSNERGSKVIRVMH